MKINFKNYCKNLNRKDIYFDIAVISFVVIITLFFFRGFYGDGMQFDEVYRKNNLFSIFNADAEAYKQSIYDIQIFGYTIPIMYKPYISTMSTILFAPILFFSGSNVIIVLRSLYYIYFIIPIVLLYFVLKRYNKWLAVVSSILIAISPLLYPGIRIGFSNVYALIPFSILLYFYSKKELNSKSIFITVFAFFLTANISFYFIWDLVAIVLILLILYNKRFISIFLNLKYVIISLTAALLGAINFILYNIFNKFPTITILFESLFLRDKYNENPIDYKQLSSLTADLTNKLKNYAFHLGDYFVLFWIINIVVVITTTYIFIRHGRRIKERNLKVYCIPTLMMVLVFTFIMISPNATGMHHFAHLAPWSVLSVTCTIYLIIKLYDKQNINKCYLPCILGLCITVLSFASTNKIVNNYVPTGGTRHFSPAIFDLAEYCKANQIEGDETIHFNWGFFSQLYFLNHGNYEINQFCFAIMGKPEEEVYLLLDQYFERLEYDEFYFPAYDSQETRYVLNYIRELNGEVILEQDFYERDGTKVISLYLIKNVNEVTKNAKEMSKNSVLKNPVNYIDFQNDNVYLQTLKSITGGYFTIGTNTDPWVKDKVSFALTSGINTLIVKGYIPDYVQEGVTGNTLNIYVNGNLVNSIWLDEKKIFEITQDISKWTSENKSTLIELVADYSYIPAKLGIGTDTRQLSYILNYIGKPPSDVGIIQTATNLTTTATNLLDLTDKVSTKENLEIWANPDVSFILPKGLQYFTLKGYIPDYVQDGITGNTLNIYVNDNLANSIWLEEKKGFDFTQDISQWIMSDEPILVEIIADYNFIPAELGINTDVRQLSYIINYIGE